MIRAKNRSDQCYEGKRRSISKAVAYHEAAHAVVGVAVGMEATPVEAHPDGSGKVHGTGQHLLLRSQYELWGQLAHILAGPLAEVRASRQSRLGVLFSKGSEDLAAARPLITWLTEHGYADNQDAAWERAEEHATDMLDEHWAAITRLAEVLLRKGFASASEVLAAIGPATEGPEHRA